MATVSSYLVAYILSLLVNLVASVVLVAFKPLVQRLRSTLIVANLVAAFVGGLGAVWAYTSLAAHTVLNLAYGMLLLPALAELWNDQRRIAKAKAGTSGVRTMLEASGEPEA